MSDLTATAERLRTVKGACLDFITFWAIDQLMAEGRHGDRIQRDVFRSSESLENNKFSPVRSDRQWTD